MSAFELHQYHAIHQQIAALAKEMCLSPFVLAGICQRITGHAYLAKRVDA